MGSLLLLLAAAALTGIWALWRRRPAARSKWEAAGFLTMGCFALGLALRFGGRTYPGIYFPDSTLLNDIFNGVWLFEQLGYDAVAVFFVARLIPLFRQVGKRNAVYLNGIAWLALVTAALIALYGFYWAAAFGRLP
jgi:hypothetical protein